MLALDDFLDMVGHPLAALQHPRQRIRACHQRRGMTFEQFKEITLSRQQSLKPCEHPAYPCFFCNILGRAARRGDSTKTAVAERTDQRLQIRFLDRRSGIAEREPFALALVHFFPLGELIGHRQREHFDIVHDRRAIRAALAIFIAADRRRTHCPGHAGLFLGLDSRGGVARHAGQRVALGDHPAFRFARRDQQDFGRAIMGGTAETIGKDGDLTHGLNPFLNKKAGAVAQGDKSVTPL